MEIDGLDFFVTLDFILLFNPNVCIFLSSRSVVALLALGSGFKVEELDKLNTAPAFDTMKCF